MKIMSYLCRAEQTVRATAYASVPDKKLNAPSRGIQFCRTNSPGLCVSSMAKVSTKTARLFACVYRFSMTITKASTESANEEKECLVKSGKVRTPTSKFVNANSMKKVRERLEKSEGYVTLM